MKPNIPKTFLTCGKHPDGSSSAALTVYLCVNKQGYMWSCHDIRSLEDKRIIQEWDGQGVRHIAHALLTEAIRRETFTCALVTLTHNPTYLEKYTLGTPDEQEQIEQDLAAKVTAQISAVLPKLTPETAKEILTMMRNTEPKEKGIE